MVEVRGRTVLCETYPSRHPSGGGAGVHRRRSRCEYFWIFCFGIFGFIFGGGHFLLSVTGRGVRVACTCLILSKGLFQLNQLGKAEVGKFLVNEQAWGN